MSRSGFTGVMASFVAWMAALAAMGNAALALLTLLAAQWWFADLAINYRMQYACFAAAMFAVAALSRRRSPAILAVVCAAIVWVVCAGPAWQTLVPTEPSGTEPASMQGTGHWRIAHANVYMDNADQAGVVAWLREQQADAVVLMETGPEWASALASVADRYPHRMTVPDFADRTVVVLSRWPMLDVTPLDASLPHASDPVVTLWRGGERLRLAALHGTWPFSRARASMRQVEFERLADAAVATTLPFVAVGDLNCTALSPHFQDMLRAGRLTDAGAGRGWHPTWPAFFMPLGIRIDHALVARGTVIDYRTMTIPGSDHLAIVVDVDAGS